MDSSTTSTGRRSAAQRVVAADAVWDLLLGLALLLAAFPAGAATLGIPATGSWLGSSVLVLVGLGSLGYAVALARAGWRHDAAVAICVPTAIANALGVLALLALPLALGLELTGRGATVVTVAAVVCAAFAGAEYRVRPRRGRD